MSTPHSAHHGESPPNHEKEAAVRLHIEARLGVNEDALLLAYQDIDLARGESFAVGREPGGFQTFESFPEFFPAATRPLTPGLVLQLTPAARAITMVAKLGEWKTSPFAVHLNGLNLADGAPNDGRVTRILELRQRPTFDIAVVTTTDPRRTLAIDGVIEPVGTPTLTRAPAEVTRIRDWWALPTMRGDHAYAQALAIALEVAWRNPRRFLIAEQARESLLHNALGDAYLGGLHGHIAHIFRRLFMRTRAKDGGVVMDSGTKAWNSDTSPTPHEWDVALHVTGLDTLALNADDPCLDHGAGPSHGGLTYRVRTDERSLLRLADTLIDNAILERADWLARLPKAW